MKTPLTAGSRIHCRKGAGAGRTTHGEEGEIWRAWVVTGPAEAWKEMANCSTQGAFFGLLNEGMRGEVDGGQEA